MRILLDECVPKRLRHSLEGHDCQTAGQAGLAGKTNGKLLSFAEELGFDVLLTVGQNLPYQPRSEGRRIAILILCGRSNRLNQLLPFLAALAGINLVRCCGLRQQYRIRKPAAAETTAPFSSPRRRASRPAAAP